MTMQRWDPFGEMLSLRSMMDRLLEDAFVRPTAVMGLQPGSFGFPLDLYEQGDELVVRASLPGVKPEDVDISVQGDTLTISGETRFENENPGTVHYQEHRYGRFSRTLTLPSAVDADKANANFEHGVLTLTLPKTEAARTRRIPIGGSRTTPIETTAKPVEQIGSGNGASEQAKSGGRKASAAKA